MGGWKCSGKDLFVYIFKHVKNTSNRTEIGTIQRSIVQEKLARVLWKKILFFFKNQNKFKKEPSLSTTYQRWTIFNFDPNNSSPDLNKYNTKMEQSKSPKACAYHRTPPSTQVSANKYRENTQYPKNK